MRTCQIICHAVQGQQGLLCTCDANVRVLSSLKNFALVETARGLCGEAWCVAGICDWTLQNE